MAKLPFSKLGIKLDTNVASLPWGEYNIEVSKYLPMSEKAEMVSEIINKSSDNNGYYNPLKVKVYLTLEVLYRYTNLSFTEKQKENELKLYDMVIGSGLFSSVVSAIPEEEWKDLQTTVWDTISNIYEYKNSVMGILEAVSGDYENLNFDALQLSQEIGNPENIELLREVLGKLG